MSVIRPLARTDDTVTLKTADYEALLRAVEDAEDAVALFSAGAREEILGKAEARADHMPVALVEHLLEGGSRVAIWREHRGLSTSSLAEAAGLTSGDLAEIEADRRSPSLAECRALASALRTSVDDLIP